ncbi:MAG TPA: carboxypeptidase-like regulatory domain-containing protein [Saprospiraceae bacterium]|nr:carboxypeptidase-like regulatory domain-containing protein [Saprospiraceae bacterium]HMP26283.1 carboxypeptidase-like regulatory domain-containing protein [Saprospiraceae bacterium]
MRSAIICLLLFFAFIVEAQDYITITGKVTDADKGRPLGYAHVGIPDKGIGTTTGMDGHFTLKIPEAYARNSVLVVSYIGYRDFRSPVLSLGDPANIRLRATPANLQEVVVMSKAGIENIIRKAVKAIPDNYPTQPNTHLAFYRESRTDSAEAHVYLAEGVLNVYKTSYKNDNEGQVSLVQGRKIILQPDKAASHAGFTAGHMAAHRFDFVKNRRDFINEKNFPDYHYWIETITTYQDLPVYVIGFDKEEGGAGRLRGRVYIDTLSYAFIRAEFEVRPEALRRLSDYPLYSGRWKANSYTINYRKLGNKWYFGDAVREGVYADGGFYSNEVIVTEINPKRSGPLPYLERLGREDAFLRITGEYDDDFWKQYNTAPLNEKLQARVLQLKNAEKAGEVFSREYMAEVERLQDSIREVHSQRRTLDETPDLSEILPRGPMSVQRSKRRSWEWQFAAGAGTHLLETEAADMTLSYLTGREGETILSTTDRLSARPLEPIYHADLRVLFHKNFFFTWNISRDLWNSYYRERGLGFGAQANLSKGRPLFLRASVQESRLRYARLLGAADNEYGNFRADGSRFKSNRVNMYYGSRTHNLKLSLELSLELNPGRELFVRGGYMLPYAERQHLYLKERQRLFNRKALLPLSDSTPVTRNGEPFNAPITPAESLFFTVGIVWK